MFVSCHWSCLKNTIPMTWPMLHWTTDNPSGIHTRTHVHTCLYTYFFKFFFNSNDISPGSSHPSIQRGARPLTGDLPITGPLTTDLWILKTGGPGNRSSSIFTGQLVGHHMTWLPPSSFPMRIFNLTGVKFYMILCIFCVNLVHFLVILFFCWLLYAL